MLIFNCTKAACDFFSKTTAGTQFSPVIAPPNPRIEQDIHNVVDEQGNTPRLSQWLVHAIIVDRKYCLIAMEVNTRFSMTFSDLIRGDSETFVNLFTERLLNNMYWLGEQLGIFDPAFFPIMTDSFLSEHDGIAFFKRSDRSVQGHINDVLRYFREQSEEIGLLPNDHEQAMAFDEMVNQIQRSSKASTQYFFPEVGMLGQWMQEYCDGNAEDLNIIRDSFRQLRSEQVFADNAPSCIDDSQALPPPDNVVSLCEFRKKQQK
ncbi:hypothetical protein EDC56_1703 [Sinobacterium caligoides]|uniref:DUF6933 domain-containing protein n=1 Tax=Sinobacterium caligoides TaxID=933926 RepID=A0A3N2DN90_9GAMM|nr:hypothetical protein [Sinobacterium caligoides]ROS01274.1 hypothetical protein EDC56_1703 [Sinobacterium caligoides]